MQYKRTAEQLERKREQDRLWREANRERMYEHTHAYIRRNWKRTLAHKKVYRYIKSGKLIRPETCSSCGNGGRIEAHHKDITKHLEIDWLCRTCHIAADKEIRNERQTS